MKCQLLRPAVALATFSASVFAAENFGFLVALLAVFARCFLFSVTPFTLSAFCFFIALNRPAGRLDAADKFTSFMLFCFALLLLLAGLLAVLQGLSYAR